MTRPQAVGTLLLEDDRVRVSRFDFAPGAETGWHVHGMDYVITTLTECVMLLEMDEGNKEVDIAAHTVYGRVAGTKHNVVNRGTAPMAFIEVELK